MRICWGVEHGQCVDEVKKIAFFMDMQDGTLEKCSLQLMDYAFKAHEHCQRNDGPGWSVRYGKLKIDLATTMPLHWGHVMKAAGMDAVLHLPSSESELRSLAMKPLEKGALVKNTCKLTKMRIKHAARQQIFWRIHCAWCSASL